MKSSISDMIDEDTKDGLFPHPNTIQLICAKTNRPTTKALCEVCKRKCTGPIKKCEP